MAATKTDKDGTKSIIVLLHFWNFQVMDVWEDPSTKECLQCKLHVDKSPSVEPFNKIDGECKKPTRFKKQHLLPPPRSPMQSDPTPAIDV